MSCTSGVHKCETLRSYPDGVKALHRDLRQISYRTGVSAHPEASAASAGLHVLCPECWEREFGC
jgi:hypothetical protein